MSEFYTATTDKPDELADVLSRAVGEKGKRVLIRRKVSTDQSLQNGGKFYFFSLKGDQNLIYPYTLTPWLNIKVIIIGGMIMN